jgi:glutamate/tyrosine decarboxylase-like PLP-dependent enzyme
MASTKRPMFSFDPAMAELIFDYCAKRLALDPVELDFGGVRTHLDRALEGLISPGGHQAEVVLERFVDHLASAVISVDSPRFLSFIPAAPTKAALLFDMVVSASSLNGTSWLEAAGAIAAENQVLRFLADSAGLPEQAGGCFVSGGSMANLSALVVARDRARRRKPALATRRLRFAVSEEAHSSITSALAVIDVDPFVVPTVDHRLCAEQLVAALDRDQDPESVVAVVATAGTTNGGIVDDLEGLGALARSSGRWFHVDAAYGGAAMLSTLRRELFSGLRHVDSFIVDPHKWLFAPFDCAALLYRDPEEAAKSHTQHASYLDIIHHDSEHDHGEWNPTDYAIQLTRRARGLPIWFSLSVYGTDAYAEAVDQGILLAEEAAEQIRAQPVTELVRAPGLSIVLFRRLGWKTTDYASWSEALLKHQVGFVTPTTWEGETVARFCFLHPETTPAMVTEILNTMA